MNNAITIIIEQVAVILGSLAILIPAGLAAYGRGRARSIGTGVFATEFAIILAALIFVTVK